MLEFIKEKNVWDTLKDSDKPLVLYGMGLGAEKIMSELEQRGMRADDIFASDEFVRGHSFKGYKVLRYSEVCEKYKDFNVVLCFASHIDEVIDRIAEIDSEHTVFAPDVPVAGGGLFTREYITENEEKFERAYSLLADEESKRVYKDILNFKVSGKIKYLLSSFCDKSKVYSDILNLNENEEIIDLGAYDGDTIREFTAATGGKYKHITALEPDKKSYKKLLKNTDGMKNISTLNMGVWSKRDTLIFDAEAGRNSKLSAEGVSIEVTDIDSLNIAPTFIKADIEGSEMKALEGAEKTIKKYLPKLYICAYHRNEDLFALPLKIKELSEKYKIYFRHSKYIPAWESNFYCVAE
ncbi:FkbM family methyltransferase [Eubacterium sp.]|uniref:FkbM family methyltransferase n=1 Tax=Eubacterium sp. TaxID=142586 RepID=UPI0025C51EA0|nr:FkbM family methyltransferase [Eubacterium sp.]MCI7800822.1 FkbM family methyltransferase [Eubacterium sp.]